MSRGLSLPARGSPRDMVLRELLHREQALRVSEFGLVSQLLAAIAGADDVKMRDALTAYVEKITHNSYGRSASKKAGLSAEEQARIARVSALNSDRS